MSHHKWIQFHDYTYVAQLVEDGMNTRASGLIYPEFTQANNVWSHGACKKHPYIDIYILEKILTNRQRSETLSSKCVMQSDSLFWKTGELQKHGTAEQKREGT